MPLYEYKCLKCGRKTEKIEPVSGPHLKKCPHCRGKVESVITAPSIQFKGSGWYVTDYAGKSAKTAGAAEGSGSEAKDAGNKEGAAKESAGKDAVEKDSKRTEAKETPSKEKKAEKKK